MFNRRAAWCAGALPLTPIRANVATHFGKVLWACDTIFILNTKDSPKDMMIGRGDRVKGLLNNPLQLMMFDHSLNVFDSNCHYSNRLSLI